LVGHKATITVTAPKVAELTITALGSTLAFYGIDRASTGTDLYRSDWTHVIFVGTHEGKGMYSSVDVTFTSGDTPVFGTAATYSTN